MNDNNLIPHQGRAEIYQITVCGRLDESWSHWLEGMVITFDRSQDGSDITILTGRMADQAALHGVLNRISDLNIPLLSLFRVRP